MSDRPPQHFTAYPGSMHELDLLRLVARAVAAVSPWRDGECIYCEVDEGAEHTDRCAWLMSQGYKG